MPIRSTLQLVIALLVASDAAAQASQPLVSTKHTLQCQEWLNASKPAERMQLLSSVIELEWEPARSWLWAKFNPFADSGQLGVNLTNTEGPRWRGSAQLPSPQRIMKKGHSAANRVDLILDAEALVIDVQLSYPSGYKFGWDRYVCGMDGFAIKAVSASGAGAPTIVRVSPAPGGEDEPSEDALLGFRGTVLAALLAALIAIPGLLIQRRQLVVTREALAHERETAAGLRSPEQLLSEGPHAFVNRFKELSEKASSAARAGDKEGFLRYARALVVLRNSLYISLKEAVRPLNSNMQVLEEVLSIEPVDLEKAIHLNNIVGATMDNQALILEAHLKQLLAAIMTVAYATPSNASVERTAEQGGHDNA